MATGTGKQSLTEALKVPEKKPGARSQGLAFFVLAGLLVLLIIAASWATDSKMTSLRWVPAWAADWADKDPNIRTAVPFIPLAFLLSLGFDRCGIKRPMGWSVILSCLCLGFSELGQVFLPTRTADVADLLWGGGGIMTGGIAGWVWGRRHKTARRKTQENES